MNSKRIIHIVFVVSLILVSGFATTPAYAKAPIHFEVPVDWSGPVENECGFPIDATTLGTQRSTFWFDEDGNLSMGHNLFNITEIWDAGGNTLEFKYNYPVHGWIEEYPDGYISYLGAEIITLPHEGLVFSAAGIVTWSFTIDAAGDIILIDMLKLAGNWETDWPAICEYLAP